MHIYDHLNNSLRINDKPSLTTQAIPIQSQAIPIQSQSDYNKQKDDVECDLCGRYYTKRGYPRHRNNCVKRPENHLANRKD